MVRTNKDRKIVIEQELEKLVTVVENQEKQVINTESALSLIEKLNEKPLSLDKAAYCVKELKVFKRFVMQSSNFSSIFVYAGKA